MKKVTLIAAVIGMFAFSANAQTDAKKETGKPAVENKEKSCKPGEGKACCKGKDMKSCHEGDKKGHEGMEKKESKADDKK